MLKIQIYSLFFSTLCTFVCFVVIFSEHISLIFLKTRAEKVIKGQKGQRDKETKRQRDRETERQRDRETERQRDRKRSALPSAAPSQASRPPSIAPSQAPRPPKHSALKAQRPQSIAPSQAQRPLKRNNKKMRSAIRPSASCIRDISLNYSKMI